MARPPLSAFCTARCFEIGDAFVLDASVLSPSGRSRTRGQGPGAGTTGVPHLLSIPEAGSCVPLDPWVFRRSLTLGPCFPADLIFALKEY